MTGRSVSGIAAMAAAAIIISGTAWADPPGGEYGHEKEGYGHDKGAYGRHGGDPGGHGGGMHGWHSSTTHLLRHMLKHSAEIGLKDDQIAKLKEMQLNLDRTRIKSEADIMIAERELKALVEDDKSDLGSIESKLKQAESLEVALRLEAIKTRKEAFALLTPEQREKERAQHEKMMQEHKMPGPAGGPAPHGDMGGSMGSPHGKRSERSPH